MGRDGPRGDFVALMRAAALPHFLAGRGADDWEHEKTGGRVWLSLVAIFKTLQKLDCAPEILDF